MKHPKYSGEQIERALQVIKADVWLIQNLIESGLAEDEAIQKVAELRASKAQETLAKIKGEREF